MIATIWKIGWLTLWRDRPALVLTFAVPLLFFSIFAAVFGSMERVGGEAVRVTVAGAAPGERTPEEASLERYLAADPRLDLEVSRDPTEAVGRVRSGRSDAGILVPAGLAEVLSGAVGGSAAAVTPRLEIVVDRRGNPVAAGVVEAAVRGAVFRLWAESRFPTGGRRLELPVDLAVEDVARRQGGDDRSISFFAAGIGVMFLLFAVSGRGSLLIEERRSGVLSRMMSSGVGLTPVLAGRWLYLASLGFVQVTLMFVWGSIAFGLDLWTPHRLTGFLVMTVAAVAAAAGLGLLLSVVCRTRAQLSGVAVLLVLAMSAVGGSLFPRFLMPEGMRRLGLMTFNAWALDGYQKVFWYESPLVDLWPQVTFLAAVAAGLLALSRVLASRSLRGAGS